MHPVLVSCRLFLRILPDLIAQVWSRDDLHLRPAFASGAVARRLQQGLRLVAAYLRRLLLIMALEIEHTLADPPKPPPPLGRPHGRKVLVRPPRFVVHSLRYSPFTGQLADTLQAARDARDARHHHHHHLLLHHHLTRLPPQPVPLAPLYRQLEFLAGIAANPLKRATRLAWHLARSHEGPMLAPDHLLPIPGRWGTEVSMTYRLMGCEVLALSRKRPPPLAPRRWHGPSITPLDW